MKAGVGAGNMLMYTQKYTRAQMMDKVHIPLDSSPSRLLTPVTPYSGLARDASKRVIWKKKNRPLVMKHADSFSVLQA